MFGVAVRAAAATAAAATASATAAGGGAGWMALVVPFAIGLAGGVSLGVVYLRAHARGAQAKTPSIGRLLAGMALRLGLALALLLVLARAGGAPALVGAALGFALLHARAACGRMARR